MEYDLTRRTVLSTESEYKELYSWSLQECDERGKKIGSPQIPWDWAVYFIASRVTHRFSVLQDSNSSQWEAQESHLPAWSTKESLLMKLSTDHSDPRNTISYSLFGTDREIEDISLMIVESSGEEKFKAWGSASKTSEIDFEDVFQPDCLFFTMLLNSSKFQQLRNLLSRPEYPEISVRLMGVSGFYSEWSPSIRTNRIKVLANAVDQRVENVDRIIPPQLGAVRGFEITVARITERLLEETKQPAKSRGKFWGARE